MKWQAVGIAIFMSIFNLIGFWLLGDALWSARGSTEAAAWPTTSGTITHVELHEESDEDGTAHYVTVQYTYTVDGVAYEGSRLAVGYIASTGRAAHEEIYRKLKGAKGVDVRYNPVNPSESCLSFGLHRSIQLSLGFAALWLSFVSGFTLVIWLCSRRDTVLLRNLSLH